CPHAPLLLRRPSALRRLARGSLSRGCRSPRRLAPRAPGARCLRARHRRLPLCVSAMAPRLVALGFVHAWPSPRHDGRASRRRFPLPPPCNGAGARTRAPKDGTRLLGHVFLLSRRALAEPGDLLGREADGLL